MEIISEDKIRYFAGKYGYNLIYLEKDYFLTLLLYLLKDVEGLYLKGGTCLNKIFLNHTRLSEDLDYVSRRPVKDVRKDIENSLDKTIFTKIGADKSTGQFVRLLIYFKSYFEKSGYIILDINSKASIHLKPENHKVENFYGLEFVINTINIEEIVAEKIRALITRNQPRDYFDAYFILQKYKINKRLVKEKVKEAGEKFDLERIFKNASRVYSKWESDLLPLTNKKVSFLTVIKALEKEFRK